MRVLVATDRVGACSARRAGEALATGWRERRPHDAIAVVPVGAAGAGGVEAYADLLGAEVSVCPAAGRIAVRATGSDTVVVGVEDPVAPGDAAAETGAGLTELTDSSLPWGEAVAAVLADPPAADWTLVLDLGGCHAHDLGLGLLGALGAEADAPLDRGLTAMNGLSVLDLAPVRERLAGVRLVGLVPADEASRLLLGLRGITSARGAAARERGGAWDPAELLASDATLERLAHLVDPGFVDAPGAGACGGAATAWAAVGAEVTTGPDWLAQRSGLARTMAAADLVVTGVTAYEFAHRGGEAVDAVVSMAADALRPVVLAAGTVTISARELRANGVEAAYAVYPGALAGTPTPVDADDLIALGDRLARTWGP